MEGNPPSGLTHPKGSTDSAAVAFVFSLQPFGHPTAGVSVSLSRRGDDAAQRASETSAPVFRLAQSSL
ncbi:hypothetical protein [Nostoc sp.]|uniref:hypothetical protein n=1 Tax=Nostoc sp. TaxID=1180 RepID=UPI002FF4D579